MLVLHLRREAETLGDVASKQHSALQQATAAFAENGSVCGKMRAGCWAVSAATPSMVVADAGEAKAAAGNGVFQPVAYDCTLHIGSSG
jgi:hypothetical protein